MNARTISILAVVLVLTVSIGSGGAGVLAADATGATVHQESDRSYVLEQGEFCQPVEALESGETIEEFYDYRDHQTHPDEDDGMYSSYGTTHLQADDTSILFLHEGPNGPSLVMVHGQYEGDGDANYVTFDVVGLPDEAEWVVRNDNYTSETNVDEFHRGDGWANASWAQRGDRTGGGAIQGGLDGEFAVTVQPAFNDEAELTPDDHGHPDPDFYDEGEVEAWDVLSGSADDPDRTTLPSLEEPVTIRTGTCEDPSVTYDRTDDGITVDVADADPNEGVDVQPTAGTNDAVRFEGIELTDVDGDASLGFASEPPEATPSSPEGVDPISHLTVQGDSIGNASATVTFGVDRELADDLDADELALYAYDREADRWVQTPTSVREETGEEYRFEATVTSLSSLAVAPQQPLEVSNLELDRSEIEEGESVEVTAELENPHDAAQTHTATFSAFGEVLDEQQVTVEPGNSETVTFEQQFTAPGTYEIEVDGERAEVTVEPVDDGSGDGMEHGSDYPIPGPGIPAVVGVLVLFLWLRTDR